MAMMYLSGDGGDTDFYKQNLEELGLFQNVDPYRVFDIKDNMRILEELRQGGISNLDEKTKVDSMLRSV